MAEEPKASFLGGKPAPAAPAAKPEPEPAPAPAAPSAPVKQAGFLQKPKPAPAPAPAPAGAKSGVQQAAKGKSAIQPAAVAPTAPPAPAAKAPKLAPGNRQAAEQHLQNGLNFYDAQDVENALQAYQLCVQADPSFGMGHNNLGMVLIDLERYDEAVQSLHNSIRCDPNYAEAYNNLGFVLRRMQRPMEASSAYIRFLELEPDVEEGDRIRGWVGTVLQENNLSAPPPFQLPENGAAAAPAPAAPAAEPQKLKKMAAWEVAAGNTATAAPVSVLGEIGPVAQTPVQPSQVSPMPPAPPPPKAGGPKPAPVPAKPPTAGGPGAYVQLIEKGMDLFAEGNMDEAANLFQQAIGMNPENAEGHTGLGKVLIRQERLPEAVEQLQKAVELDPDDPAAYYVLGFSLRAMERNVEAAENYQVYLKLMPNALDADRMRQWVGLVLGADAVGLVEPIEESADDEPIATETDGKYKIALDHFQAGDAAGSEGECVAILTADPGHYRTRLLLGRCYLRQKKIDAAVEQFQNVLISRPDYPEALYFLGQAHDKLNDPESAKENYQRYLDIAPTGPRAQRVEDWFLARGHSKSGSGEQQQCELCLRFFGPSEITQHEGKATCVNCMAVMGGAPIMPSPPPPSSQKAGALTTRTKDAPLEDIEEIVAIPKRSHGMAIAGVLGAIIILGSVAFFLGYLDPVLKAVGLAPKRTPKPPPVTPDIDPAKKDPPDAGPFDFTKIKFTGEAPKVAAAFATWRFAPVLEGYNGLEEYCPGWTRTFTLKGGPQGMFVDPATGAVTWTPRNIDPEILKRGEAYRVELEVVGRGKPVLQPDERELFKLALPFTVAVQFAYELGPEMDLGLGPTDYPALVGGDFNADGLADLAAGVGSFRSGGLNLYIQRKNSPLGTPTALEKSGRFSAVAAGDIDGDKHEDLIGTAWMSSQLKLFKQTGADVVPAGETVIGQGPVAVSLSDLDGDGKSETAAALLSASGALVVSRVDPAGKFGPVKSVPMRSGGPRAMLFDYKSTSGMGLLAVLPLAPAPLQFVPYDGGNFGATPVGSTLEAGQIIRSAAVLKSAKGSMRLALLTLSQGTYRVIVLREQNRRFAPAGEPLTLPEQAAGLLAYDFNGDGEDDLLLVEVEELEIAFSGANDEWLTGYRIKSPRLLGPAAVLKGSAPRADVVLIGENRKGHFLRAVINEPPPPLEPVSPAPAAPDAPASAAKSSEAK